MFSRPIKNYNSKSEIKFEVPIECNEVPQSESVVDLNDLDGAVNAAFEKILTDLNNLFASEGKILDLLKYPIQKNGSKDAKPKSPKNKKDKKPKSPKGGKGTILKPISFDCFTMTNGPENFTICVN